LVRGAVSENRIAFEKVLNSFRSRSKVRFMKAPMSSPRFSFPLAPVLLRQVAVCFAALAVQFPAVAGPSGGRVVGWGTGYPIANMPADLTNVTAVAAGPQHAVALRADGAVVAWGYGSGLEVPGDLGEVNAVGAGYNYSLALRRDGTVRAWGTSAVVRNLPGDLHGVVAIAAGYDHALALMSDGTVVAWGQQNFGCLDVPPNLTNVIAIAAGHSQNLALRADGTVVFWGYGSTGAVMPPPAGLTNVVAIALGTVEGGSVDTTHCLALRGDGKVVAWGANTWGKCEVPPDLPRVTAVAAGRHHSLALTADYRVVGWGYNAAGQCTPPEPLGAVRAIAAANQYSLAIIETLPPVLVGQPASRLVSTGETITLVAAGNGTPPLTWQWYFNGQPVPWGTGPALTLTNIQIADCGAYQVELRNPYGVARSDIATVAIRVLDLQMVAGLTLENPPGTALRVEWSDDLQTWHPLTNLVLPYSPYRFVDWEAPQHPRRYYRIQP